jgi:Tol biopolymer transport system component
MPLSPGTRRGPYEILAPLGAGGMGEVYRARDTRLQRDVAIKALPEEFAQDAERLARFQREAQLLASLNHPNIAAIYGLEEADGGKYLVLEIVEGESLAERLAAGPMRVEEALAAYSQIAAGVSAAHEAGVIHRDLKPGNVMVRGNGSVKVLDFGLARGVETPGSSVDRSRSPTISVGTEQGVILGTAAYMSPEQARGRPLDKRTDIWSFGCVLYECLTGRQVFHGESATDTLASIIRSEPDWNALPGETPDRTRDLLKRCLQKDPERRLHDIADARLEIEEALAAPAGSAATAPLDATGDARRARPRLAWGVAGLLAGAAAAILAGRALRPAPAHESPAPIRSVLPLPADTRLLAAEIRPSMAFSPDGSRLVFRAVRDGRPQLYMRPFDRLEAVPIPETEDGYDPFFSPDGEWLAFYTELALKKVSLAGGMPLTITWVPPITEGGVWTPDGFILFPRVNSGLFRVPASGGVPEPFTTPDGKNGEHAHVLPQLLPGGENLLLIVRAGKDFQDIQSSNLAIHSLKTGKRRVLLQGITFARYAPPGHLLLLRGRSVQAAPFDPEKGELTGPPVALLTDVLIAGVEATPYLAAGSNGVLAYASGGVVDLPMSMPVWVDRSGAEEKLPLPPGFYGNPRLSPDGKTLALFRDEGARESVWTYDFSRRIFSNLVPEPGRSFDPTWTPDGRRIAFCMFNSGAPQLCWKPADGSGAPERLTSGVDPEFPNSFSPDGRLLAYTVFPKEIGNGDLWLLSMDGKRERRAYLESPFKEFGAFFSPDGRWIAYTSSESGRNEVYVRPFPGPGGRVKISSDGGAEPAWSADRKELYYRSGDRLMAVRVETTPVFATAAARVLLTDRYARGGDESSPREYDVSPDGTRFLFLKPDETKEQPITQLRLIANWPALLARAPGEKH